MLFLQVWVVDEAGVVEPEDGAGAVVVVVAAAAAVVVGALHVARSHPKPHCIVTLYIS